MAAGWGAKSQGWGGDKSQGRGPGPRAELGKQSWLLTLTEASRVRGSAQIKLTSASRGLQEAKTIQWPSFIILPGILHIMCYGTLGSQEETGMER